jgi:hypothetical protein
MPYYVRAFCKSTKIPKIEEIFNYANGQGFNFRLELNEGTLDNEGENWHSFEMKYKEGKSPIIVELNLVNDTDEIGKEEVQEFIEEIGSPGISLKKRKVINHLKETKYIIANQLLGDIDDDGYDANGEFMKYFVDNFEGMQYADGEGFYDKDMTLLLKDK